MWEAMSIGDRRITLEIVEVTILPTDRRGTPFDADSIRVTLANNVHDEIRRYVPEWDRASDRPGTWVVAVI